MDFNNIPTVDEAEVRRFHRDHPHPCCAGQSTAPTERASCSCAGSTPLDEDNVVPSRFQIGDVEAMVKVAIDDANAGHNVYIEARTVRCELRGKRRGSDQGDGLGSRLCRRQRRR